MPFFYKDDGAELGKHICQFSNAGSPLTQFVVCDLNRAVPAGNDIPDERDLPRDRGLLYEVERSLQCGFIVVSADEAGLCACGVRVA